MSDCCASVRVYFPGGLFVHVWVCTHTPTCSRRGGGVWLVWNFRVGRWLQSKAHPEPGVSGVWAAPAVKGAGHKAHCSSERVVGVCVLTLLLSQFDTVFGFFVFVFFFSFFRRSGRVKFPLPQSNGNMKPFVLLMPLPVSTFSCPSLPSLLPAAFPYFVCLSPTFRQLQHSSVWIVTHSGTLDQFIRFTVAPRSAHVPSAAPFLHEHLVFGMFSDTWAGSSPYPPCGVIRRERRIFIRNWFCVINLLLCFVLFCFDFFVFV